MPIFNRFDDAETERAYVTSERRARIPASRALILIGIATFVSYITLNPMYFPREGVIAYNIAAGLFMAVLAGFFLLTRTRFYLEQGWIDLALFTALTVAMAMLIEALGDQADVTGISRFGMAIINMGILVVFASVGFVATTRLFFLWALTIMALYLAYLISIERAFITKVYTLTNFSTFFVFASFVNWDIDRRARKTFAANRALDAEKQKSEELLYNVLPQHIAARLKSGEAVADAFSDVSVIFVDIVGFSQLAKRMSAGHLVELLNRFFLLADECAQRYEVEKVKTIGDAYLAVCGGTASCDSGAECAIRFGRDLIEAVEALGAETGVDIQLRIGIHTGPVVGGVVGASRLSYDYWGDTMNIASRIEGVAEPNGIAVSETTFYQAKPHFEFSAGETLILKGVGETQVYRLLQG
ncbi:adenylate/guanylate cyclase domain-containing protein [uncultured Parasphingopyxis sp.]|uniref:adenylate/guanylate cyclase domain-containing protein n=1 Tax=uncultured Parasphingopyxis sp. TaxID=1547918 RepID=UPI002634D032|nr:adenylate/guanylate cyclase domain-containing protein [uncultured Parasphingopyxis sp.]